MRLGPEREIHAVGLGLEDGLAGLFAVEPVAHCFALIGDDLLDQGDRSSITVTVRGGNLRRAPPTVLWHGRVEGRRRESPVGDRITGNARRVERRGRDHDADAVLFARGQTNEEVGTEDVGHLVFEKLANGGAGDATHDLTNEVALGYRVIARGGAGWPPGRLSGEDPHAPLPVREVFGPHWLAEAREPGGVAHHVAHLNGLFAVGGEFGPVGRDAFVKVEFATVGQHQRNEERHGLGGGPDVHERVLGPGGGLFRVAIPTPDVDDEFAAFYDRD